MQATKFRFTVQTTNYEQRNNKRNYKSSNNLLSLRLNSAAKEQNSVLVSGTQMGSFHYPKKKKKKKKKLAKKATPYYSERPFANFAKEMRREKRRRCRERKGGGGVKGAGCG